LSSFSRIRRNTLRYCALRLLNVPLHACPLRSTGRITTQAREWSYNLHMKTKERILEALAAHPTELEQYGVKSVAVFGSAARGEKLGPQSDIDLLVEFNRPVGLFAFLDVKQYLETLLKRRVDPTTPEALKPPLRDQILRFCRVG